MTSLTHLRLSRASHVDRSSVRRTTTRAMGTLARLERPRATPRVGVGVARGYARAGGRARSRTTVARAEEARGTGAAVETSEETLEDTSVARRTRVVRTRRREDETGTAVGTTTTTSTDSGATMKKGKTTRARRRRRESGEGEDATIDGGRSAARARERGGVQETGRGRRSKSSARERWADERARAATTSMNANILLDAEEERALGESIQRLLRIEREVKAREDEETAKNLEAAGTLGAVEAIALRERQKKESKGQSKDSLAISLGYANASQLRTTMREGKMARKKLVTANIPFAASVATKLFERIPPHERASMSLQDMVHEGVLGLVRASEKYDPAKGYRFTTYAYRWIVKWVTIGVHTNGRTIRLPQHAHEWRRAAQSRRKDVEADLGREATLEEVAESTAEFSVEKLRLLRDMALNPLSLDGEDDVFASPSHNADEVSREMENELFRDELSRVFEREDFPKIEAYVLAHRFGLIGEPTTRNDIAKRIGKTAEGVRYLEQKALDRLKDLDLEQHLDRSHDVVQAIEPPKEETEKPKRRRGKKSSLAASERKPAKDASPSAIDLVRSSGLL